MRRGSGQNYIAELILLIVQARSELVPDWTEWLQDVAAAVG